MVNPGDSRFRFLLAAPPVLAILFFLSRAVGPRQPPAPLRSLALLAPPAQPTAIPRRGPEDPEELARFLDPIVQGARLTFHVPGATLAVVKGGKLFYAKGYGYANLDKKTPVSADRTLFRMGSVSKLFTATAVMQLSEQGRVDLHADVNRYLTHFKIRKTYPEPVTLANILTHTAGFDEQILGSCSRTEASTPSLGDYLAERMPPRFAPPGTVISYSNHGSALAGYIVQTVSGLKFDDYMEKNLFGPLQMSRSSFSLPPRLAPDLATGYTYQNDAFHPLPYLYLNIPPAGSLNATAVDMSHFMIAHLQNGRYANARILKDETAQEMHRRQFTAHPGLPGIAYGFYERFQNGERAIEHGGLLPGYSTMLLLLPERHVGIFISCNAARPLFNEVVVQQFLNHYYPPQVTSITDARPEEDLQRFAGSYRYNRYDRHTLFKLNMLGSDVRVTAPGDGALWVDFPSAGVTQWVPIGPLLFQLRGGQQRLAFGEDAHGRITHGYLSIVTFDRLAWYETNAVQFRILILSFMIFFATLVRALLRSRRRAAPPSEIIRRARVLAVLISAGNLAFIIGFYFAFATAGWELLFGTPPLFVALLCIPMVTLMLTASLGAALVEAWRKDRWNFLDRGQLIVLTVIALAFTWFLYYWNLLGFRV